MSVAGLGVDIIEIDRMERALAKSPNIRSRAFTLDEQEYCDNTPRPEIHYAMRFAAKEAILKALGTGLNNMKLTDISVVVDDNGKPQPILIGHAREVMDEKGILEIHLSLSYTRETAVASALAITEGARPVPKTEKPDQMAELANSFKEMRSMLDTIDEVDPEEDEEQDLSGDAGEEDPSKRGQEEAEGTASIDEIAPEYKEPTDVVEEGLTDGATRGSAAAAMFLERTDSPLEEELGGIDVYEHGEDTH